jgi:hypothetical protein
LTCHLWRRLCKGLAPPSGIEPVLIIP